MLKCFLCGEYLYSVDMPVPPVGIITVLQLNIFLARLIAPVRYLFAARDVSDIA